MMGLKMNAYTTTLLQLGALVALFCIMAVSADERPNSYIRRSEGWTPQAMFLYGIMPPKRQNEVSYRKRAWGPRPNIMRAWHPERLSRDVRTLEDLNEEDDEDKRTGWTSRQRVFGGGKRVPEELHGFEDLEQFPLLKRMFGQAEKRKAETAEFFNDDISFEK